MSAATVAHPLAVPARAAPAPDLARLTAVELRKMTDTRAGFWLLLAVVVLTIAGGRARRLFGRRPGPDAARDARARGARPRASCCRSSGSCSSTSEWSQRTA